MEIKKFIGIFGNEEEVFLVGNKKYFKKEEAEREEKKMELLAPLGKKFDFLGVLEFLAENKTILKSSTSPYGKLFLKKVSIFKNNLLEKNEYTLKILHCEGSTEINYTCEEQEIVSNIILESKDNIRLLQAINGAVKALNEVKRLENYNK